MFFYERNAEQPIKLKNDFIFCLQTRFELCAFLNFHNNIDFYYDDMYFSDATFCVKFYFRP